MQPPVRRWILTAKSLSNLRDLGGYACDGGVTRFGQVLRSEGLVRVAEEDMRQLVDKGLTDVIDLRGEMELSEFPNAFRYHGSVSLHEINLKTPMDTAHGPVIERLGDAYIRTVDARGTVIVQILDTIARAPGMAIFHCYAGKDRTGIIAAMLLRLLGVDILDVLADYQVSETYLHLLLEQLVAQQPDIEHYKLTSDASDMARLLHHVDRTYGGVPAYLQANGLTEELRERLRAKLVNPA